MLFRALSQIIISLAKDELNFVNQTPPHYFEWRSLQFVKVPMFPCTIALPRFKHKLSLPLRLCLKFVSQIIN
ncbi:MAG: hypothetical protein ACTS6G_00310 [Candidatus Hodgkinia cicadicola]